MFYRLSRSGKDVCQAKRLIVTGFHVRSNLKDLVGFYLWPLWVMVLFRYFLDPCLLVVLLFFSSTSAGYWIIWKYHKVYFAMKNTHLCVRLSVCNIDVLYLSIVVALFISWLRHNGLPKLIRELRCVYNEKSSICMDLNVNYEYS